MRRLRLTVWLPGLLVATGAAVATAHGLYEVAVASGVPAPVAWLYPLITDGLALVAYAATARLVGSAARYAWAVVVVSAGLSGLAQACYLAGGVGADAPAALRFGVGAWPAVAAATVAHLLHLLIASIGVQWTAEQPNDGRTALDSGGGSAAVAEVDDDPQEPAIDTAPVQPYSPPSEAPVRSRAQAAARRHVDRYGALPTVSQLMELAEVSRGTAGEVLKALRHRSTPLHLVNPDETTRTQR